MFRVSFSAQCAAICIYRGLLSFAVAVEEVDGYDDCHFDNGDDDEACQLTGTYQSRAEIDCHPKKID